MEMKAANSVERAVEKGIPAQETTAKIAERVIMSIASLEDRVATTELTAAQATPIDRKHRSLAESKCIGNLKTLGSDKSGVQGMERQVHQCGCANPGNAMAEIHAEPE